MPLLPIAFIAGAYLLGSIPFGLLLARWRVGVDVRESGSGNIGATNVLRVAGKSAGIVVLVLDALKGLAPTLAVRLLVPDDEWLHAEVGIAAIVGHVFTVWLRFRGGKGVATALGVFVVLLPKATLAGVVVFTTVVLAVRIVSIGSLLGAVTVCVEALREDAPDPYTWLAVAATVLIGWRHRGNIVRLARHQEPRI